MPPFKNYKLGQEGVDVDSAELQRSPFSLRKAQNAILDALGVRGGIRKRLGLTKFNSSVFAGAMVGGTSMPLASFIDNRTIYFAAQDGSSNENWYTSSNLFVTVAQAAAVGHWQDPTAYFSGGAGLCRMGAFHNGELFYASSNYTSGTTSPTIRAFNGTDDREISRILPATTLGITGMFSSKGVLYILTLDSGTTDANFVGRVFSMNTNNGNLTQIGAALTTGHVPVSLAVHNNLLFVGTARVTTTNEAVVLRINPIDETSWTTDLSASADDYAITSLTSFNGLLYATTKNGGAATKGKILQRSVAGSYSTVDSTSNNSGTYDGSAVFGGALYVSSRSYSTTTSTAVIRKSTDGSSWSTVYNSSSTAGVGLMRVLGLRIFSQFSTAFLHSTDGASWTSVSHGTGGNVDGALGILLPRGDAQWSDPTETGTGPGGTVNINVTNVAASTVNAYMLSETTTLTDTELRNLNTTTNVKTVGAARPGYILHPIAYTLTGTVSATGSGSQTLGIRHSTSTTAISSTMTHTVASAGVHYNTIVNTANVTISDASSPDIRGAALILVATSNTISGYTATTNWQLTVTYMATPVAT